MNQQPEKVSLVVGASSGIGKATALHLTQRGHRVVAIARNAGALDESAKEAESSFEPLALDITAPSAEQALHSFLEDRNVAVRNVV